jgi:lipopolysaccharide biosynthesis glycosyltransferase
VDTDVVFQRDVTHVFDEEFDIAVTDRVGSAWEHSPDVKHMPYNMGVTFSRNKDFWKRAGKILKTLPEQLQEWAGDQLVVCELQKQYDTKVLPGLIYNFTPWKREDDTSRAAIVHYKGSRKAWIPS